MVAKSEAFRADWQRDRERREIAELERLAVWLIALWGHVPSRDHGDNGRRWL